MKPQRRKLSLPTIEKTEAKLPTFKWNLHTIANVSAVVLFLGSVIPSYRTFQKDRAESTAKIAELDSQVTELAKRAEELAKERQVARETASEPKKEGQTKSASNGLDSTWTSVLWKLATLTQEGIVIQQIEFQNSGEQGPARKVLIDGSAESLEVLRVWLEKLSQRLPNSAFVMDRQSRTADNDYPIIFKVTASIL